MATMDSLLKALEDMKATMTQMNSTMETLAPLAPSAADLAALPGKVADLQKSVRDVGDQLQSVSVAVKRLESGDRSAESSSAKQKVSAGDGLMGAPLLQHHRPPPPPQTSFHIRVGRLLLGFAMRKEQSARSIRPRTGCPRRSQRRPQKGRLCSPPPTGMRRQPPRGRCHRWPLRGRLRWQPWRASSSHRLPPTFHSALLVSNPQRPAPSVAQIAALNVVTELVSPVERCRAPEMGLWWAKTVIV